MTSLLTDYHVIQFTKAFDNVFKQIIQSKSI